MIRIIRDLINKKALQAEIAAGYHPDNDLLASIAINNPAILREKLSNPIFSGAKDYIKFKRIAEKSLRDLEKYLGPKNKNPRDKEIAEKTISSLTGLANSLIVFNRGMQTEDQKQIQIVQIRAAANEVKKSATLCSRMLSRHGRRIKGALLLLAGIGMQIAGAAVAVASAGFLALPVSAPLMGGGLLLSAAGIGTLFGPRRIKGKLNSAAKLSEKIADKILPKPSR